MKKIKLFVVVVTYFVLFSSAFRSWKLHSNLYRVLMKEKWDLDAKPGCSRSLLDVGTVIASVFLTSAVVDFCCCRFLLLADVFVVGFWMVNIFLELLLLVIFIVFQVLYNKS